MAPSYNRILHTAASASALRHSTMPVFLCDENFHLCMKSLSLAGILSVSTGRNMAKHLSPALVSQLKQMGSGSTVGELQLPCEMRIAFITVGYLHEQRYYAFVLNSLQINPAFRQADIFYRMLEHISSTVVALLDTPMNESNQMLLSCHQLQRIYHYVSISYEDSVRMSTQMAEFSPLLNDVVSGFSNHLTAMGGKITVMENSASYFFVKASPMCYGSILSVMVTAAILASSNGQIIIQSHDDLAGYDRGTVTIAIPAPSPKMSIDSMASLMDALPMLRLDLSIIKELAAWQNISLDFCRTERLLAFDISIPYTDHGRVVLHSPQGSKEELRLDDLIEQLCSTLDAYRTYTL